MHITLKKVEHSDRMSQETSCFVADVYADGVRLGTAQNDGHGGETLLRGDFKALHEYAATLPEATITLGDYSFQHKQHAEDLVENALHAHLLRKDMKKAFKKYALWGADGKVYQVPLANKRAGVAYLNDMPENEALAIYKTA